MKNRTELIAVIEGRSEELSKAISSRRRLLRSAGFAMGGSALGALALSKDASPENTNAIDIAGLWEGVVSGNGFQSFKTFELYGAGI